MNKINLLYDQRLLRGYFLSVQCQIFLSVQCQIQINFPHSSLEIFLNKPLIELYFDSQVCKKGKFSWHCLRIFVKIRLFRLMEYSSSPRIISERNVLDTGYKPCSAVSCNSIDGIIIFVHCEYVLPRQCHLWLLMMITLLGPRTHWWNPLSTFIIYVE